MHPRLIPLLLLIVAAVSPVAVAGPASLTDAQRAKLIALVKADAEAKARFASLRTAADAALSAEPNPIKSIRSEGKLKSDPEKIRTGESMHDVPKVEALGWADAVTGEAPYAAKAKQFLVAWAKVNESRGDPIDDTGLEGMIVAYDLIHATCDASESRTIEKWLRQVADAEVASGKSKKVTSTINNWHSHRLKIVGLIGLTLKDAKLTEYVTGAFHELADHNLYPDGSTYDFHERDALHYHCYDLEPLLTLAIAARQAGLGDWYAWQAPKGGSIAKSVAFLVPYCRGDQKHAEWVHSKVEFDRKRAESGDPHYKAGTPFEPKSGRRTLELAAFFDPSLNELVVKLSGAKATRFATWQQVLNAAMKAE